MSSPTIGELANAAWTHGLDAIDLRAVYDQPQDHANPVAPSSIAGVVTGTATPNGR